MYSQPWGILRDVITSGNALVIDYIGIPSEDDMRMELFAVTGECQDGVDGGRKGEEDEQVDGWTGGWTDGRTDRRMD